MPSNVGPCFAPSPTIGPAVPLTCELDAGHTGAHLSGHTAWTNTEDGFQARAVEAMQKLAEVGAQPARTLTREDELRIHAASLAIKALDSTGFKRVVDGVDLTTPHLIADARQWLAFLNGDPATTN